MVGGDRQPGVLQQAHPLHARHQPAQLVVGIGHLPLVHGADVALLFFGGLQITIAELLELRVVEVNAPRGQTVRSLPERRRRIVGHMGIKQVQQQEERALLLLHPGQGLIHRLGRPSVATKAGGDLIVVIEPPLHPVDGIQEGVGDHHGRGHVPQQLGEQGQGRVDGADAERVAPLLTPLELLACLVGPGGDPAQDGGEGGQGPGGGGVEAVEDDGLACERVQGWGQPGAGPVGPQHIRRQGVDHHQHGAMHG